MRLYGLRLVQCVHRLPFKASLGWFRIEGVCMLSVDHSG